MLKAPSAMNVNRENAYMEAFRVQKMLMTWTGIWPREEFGFAYKLYGFLMSFALQIIFMMPSLFFVVTRSTDMALGSYILFCTLTIITYSIKLIVLYLRRNLFYKILNDLEQPLFKIFPREYDIFVKDAVVISVGIRKLIHFPCIVFVIFIAAFPTFDKSSERSLPFTYPLNVNKASTSLYVFIYCMQILAAAVCACNNGNLDTLACSFMALGTAQLEILGENLRNLAVSAYLHDNGQNVEYYKKIDLLLADEVKRCVKHHIAICCYVETLEELFKDSCLAQFVTSLAAIGIAGFSFLVIPVSNILFEASLSYFAAAMVEISIYCLFGDELMIQSLKIRDACYMSEWNNCGPKTRKSLFIIMERSKRPLVLTARKFAILSRASLVSICKSSFSYFAVLRKLYGEQ